MKYILDSGMGTELEAREINIPDWKKSIWTANALIFNPDTVKDIHIENIEAGSNVIITKQLLRLTKYSKKRKLKGRLLKTCAVLNLYC
jgi:Homocysteine/selenocysteine methylase (S-methylmethionine-dependent)